eukprot:CAMPEP_0183396182 /NCGR_PEP_ID=MMETSP0370-20130417/9855_1 /TAXON_ID=268820 /ORGANISM="Peridinium aciculiferum, Strain PAER-2" /LENGTH=91 /DNA_ID=CAMNT_0025576939 /DNA_START=58 /DNA_END=329 /DNA_ORIENTATION=-
MAKTGTCKNWLGERGFGFLAPDGGGDDVFCHVQALSGFEGLEKGARVRYDDGWDEKSGKSKASNVSLLSGPAPPAGAGGGKGGGKGGGGGG